MPRFIKAQDIPMKKRHPHLARYRRQLRDALMNPAITAEQRAEIKNKLDSVGLPKVYVGNPTPSTPSTDDSVALEPAPVPTSDTPPVVEESSETLDDLLALEKDELLTLAEDEGATAYKSWNKDKIAEAILEHRSDKV